MKIYIAGPMTGIPDLNFPAFHATAASLRAAGHTVINPAELNTDPNASWHECMKIDIQALVTCDSICLLPNWTISRGARLEFHIASQLGMQVIEASAFLPTRLGGRKPRWFGVDLASGRDKTAHCHRHGDSNVQATGEPK
ncbi:DUF4406 domain-containing protein [Paracandidimonas soli]|uniref:Uncharacterized protein DUF4406 n=1 Tax=Paracandidimonas soli TaxID=1917182 RepID=A0A4R3VCY7_9BURK|nr:DUF4406 domain-containing protein [Paracandidimonas soli]TCV00535.1 uncharacterized protein DUF4406 [Paracandidimonas soli]